MSAQHAVSHAGRPSTAITMFALLMLAACSDTPATPSPTPQLPPLATGSWYMNIADGQSLPAMVAHRLVNGKVEQTFVDSAQLVVNANGTWQQTTHLNRALIGLPATDAPIIDAGTWAPTDSGYLFRSAIANRDFVIRAPGTDSMRITQRLVEFPEAGLVVSEFRRTRPPQSLAVTWRAISARGAALPALVESFTIREPGEQPYSWHAIVDSIRLELTSQRTYAHHVYYSSWVGAPDGPPVARAGSTKRSDTGAWTSSQGQMRLESRYYHQHVLTGAIQSDGTVLMDQGLGPLEDRFTVRFARDQ